MMGRLAHAARLMQALGAVAILVGFWHLSTALAAWPTPDWTRTLSLAGATLAASLPFFLPKAAHDAPVRWNAWVRRRVRARALLWTAPLGLACFLIAKVGWNVPFGYAVGLAMMLGRWGPTFGPGAHTWWAATPMAVAWRWLCPPMLASETPGWARCAHLLCDDHPHLDGQVVMPQHSSRIRIVPMTVRDDPTFALGATDPVVLLRPPYEAITRHIAHGRERHLLMYPTSYGGISATNSPDTIHEHAWVQGWLACIGDRDPVPGEAWALNAARTAHDKLATAQARQQA